MLEEMREEEAEKEEKSLGHFILPHFFQHFFGKPLHVLVFHAHVYIHIYI